MRWPARREAQLAAAEGIDRTKTEEKKRGWRRPAWRTAEINRRSSSASRGHRLHSSIPHPGIDLPLRFVAGHTVAFLNSPDQLLSTPLDLVKVVVSQLSPFLANTTLQLGPLAFQGVLVHLNLQSRSRSTARAAASPLILGGPNLDRETDRRHNLGTHVQSPMPSSSHRLT